MVADEDEPLRPNTVVTVSLSIMIGVCFLKQLVKHNNYLHAAWERNTPFGGPARATLRQEVRHPWWNENRLVLEWRRSISAHGYRPDHFWDVVSNHVQPIILDPTKFSHSEQIVCVLSSCNQGTKIPVGPADFLQKITMYRTESGQACRSYSLPQSLTYTVPLKRDKAKRVLLD